MLTEEEAKTKWCPFARYSSKEEGWKRGINRWVGDDSQFNPVPAQCIASECMAWRWNNAALSLVEGEEPEGSGWEKSGKPFGFVPGGQTSQRWIRRQGYCGLAGKA